MTAEQFESILQDIRRSQGTETPVVQVTTAAATIRGRLAAVDHDASPRRRKTASPFGLVALEKPGLVSGPSALVQIADIPEGGLLDPLHLGATMRSSPSV